MLCNGNGAISHLQTEMGFVKDSCYSLSNWWKYIFCSIWNLLCENRNLKRIFLKKVPYNPLMGCFPFANHHFQMGVTIMGFAVNSFIDQNVNRRTPKALLFVLYHWGRHRRFARHCAVWKTITNAAAQLNFEVPVKTGNFLTLITLIRLNFFQIFQNFFS